MDSVSDECDRTGISSFLYEFLLNGRRHIKFYEFWRNLNVFIFTVLYKGMSSDLSGAVVLFVPTEADPPPPPDETHPDYVAGPTGTTGNTISTSSVGPFGTQGGPTGLTGSTETFLNPGTMSVLQYIKDVNGNTVPTQATISYVKRFMNEDYSDAGFNMSTSMDIIAVYIKAQKI